LSHGCSIAKRIAICDAHASVASPRLPESFGAQECEDLGQISNQRSDSS
jgi:hypothetical protein